MIEQEFDIELENRKSWDYTRRLSVEEYKDLAELRAEQELLDSSFRYNVQMDKELQELYVQPYKCNVLPCGQ